MESRFNIEDRYNTAVDEWRRSVVAELKGSMDALGIKHVKTVNGKGSKRAARGQVGSRTRKNNNMVSRISFRFPRHLVFVHKGVGKGRPISKPSGAKEWFNPVVEARMEGLADIVAENVSDLVVSTSFERLKIS